MKTINKAQVLMIATNGFEEAELFEPLLALIGAGVTVTLASINKRPIYGVIYDDETGMSNVSDRYITPDIIIDEVEIEKYDALVLPGGVISPDKLRMIPKVVDIVKQFNARNITIATICHGPWLLIEADIIREKRATGWYAIRTDIANAGAEVIDQEVVIDGNIITSRMPADIPAFTKAILEKLSN